MGSDNAGDDRRNVGLLGALSNALENRLMAVLIAAAAGVLGSMGLVQLEPGTVRPDPFTGAMGHELERRLSARIDRIEASDNTVREIVTQHLIRGEQGFQRIAELERRVARLENAVNASVPIDMVRFAACEVAK